MSYTYLQAQGEESSAECFSDIAPFAPSKSNPFAAACYFSGSGMDYCLGFPSGTTFEPLTGTRGEGSPMSFAVVSPVKTSAPQMQRPSELMADEADSGARWRELSARFCLDTCSWKTHRALWSEVLPWFSVILPEWGIMRAGECWEVATLAPRTNATASGSWVRSPMQKDGRGFYRASLTAAKNRTTGGRTIHWIHQALLSSGWSVGTSNPRFSEILMAWPPSWTDLEPLETDKFRQWFASHGKPSPAPNP